MRKATAIILGIIAPLALITVMVARRASDKGNDPEHKTLTTTALLMSLMWFLRDSEAREGWGNRIAAGIAVAGAGAVWIPGVMNGLTNAGRHTAALFQDDKPKLTADGTPPARALPEDSEDRIVLQGVGSLDALDKIVKAAQKMPDGNKIVDLYLKSEGLTASPEGDAIYEYEIQGPVGWYGDGAPKRMAIATGMVRYNQDGSVEAGPFDWADKLKEALDGGHARLTPIENAPTELVNGLAMMLSEIEFPVQMQVDSAVRAAARTSAEVSQATKETAARTARKNASEELASISPFLTAALKTDLGKDVNWWSMQKGHQWVQPLLMDFASQSEKNAQTVVAALSPFISHQNGRHYIPLVNIDELDTPEIVDVSDLVGTHFSDEQILNICPQCAAAAADDDDDDDSPATGNANKSRNNKSIANLGFQNYTIIMQGYDGNADNWGLRFTVADSNMRVVAEGKMLDSQYLPKMTWPGNVPTGVTLNVIAAPGVNLASGDMVMNAVSKWLRKQGVTVNGSAWVQSM